MNKKLRKRHLLMSLMLIAITTVASVAAVVKVPKVKAATPVVSVSTVVAKEPGKTFLVNISITGVTDLFLWVLNLTWDPNITKITTGDRAGLYKSRVYYNIYEGPFLKSVRSTLFFASKIDNKNGKITNLNSGYTTRSSTTTNGDGVLVTINFTLVNVGTTTLDINGPSPTYPGHSMLVDSSGNEIPHEDIDGAVLDKEPPPPPIWTQSWFQTSVIAVAVVGAVIVAGAYTVKKRKERGPGLTEEEELEQLLKSEGT